MKTPFLYFLRYIGFPFTKLFIKRIEGVENIPSHNNFLVSANHLNGRDHFFVVYALEKKAKDLRFVGAMDTLGLFLKSSLLYYLSNTIKIHRKKEDRESILRKMQKRIKNDKIIVIYPEGDSNPKPRLLKGKSGIAELVLREEIPVLPIGLQIKKDGRVIKIGKLMNFSKEVKKSKKLKNKEEKYYLLLRRITDRIMRKISKLSQKPYLYEKNK